MQASKQTYPILLDCMPPYWPKLHRDSSSQGQGQAGLPDGVQHPGRWPWDLAWPPICTSPEVAGLRGHMKRFFLTNNNVRFDQCGPREKGTTTSSGNAGCWWTQENVFLTEIKVIFDHYHQQMTPIPPELDMQVPGRLL